MNQLSSCEVTPLHIKYKYVMTPVTISYRLLNYAAENLILQTEYFGPFFTFFLPCPYTINHGLAGTYVLLVCLAPRGLNQQKSHSPGGRKALEKEIN